MPPSAAAAQVERAKLLSSTWEELELPQAAARRRLVLQPCVTVVVVPND